MGIRGLTTYINNRSYDYLENYGLCDTYLVIDANSIACQIYMWYTKSNCAFGGDYDKYASCVADFYDRLLKCHITPLLIFDGGFENKKLKTIILRTKEKIRVASSYSPSTQRTSKFMPLFLKHVFQYVTAQKGIKQVQCLFEADNAIAAVAKILNCPVLSYDSDFYIYGTLYIPFHMLETYVTKKPDHSGYMIPCKIFRVEHFLNSFKGLSQATLPLAAILLGNDYVKKGTFKYFFKHIKLHKNSRRRISNTQRRIEATFTWLSRHSLNDAVILILSRIRKPFRRRLLNIIEEHVNGYEIIPPEILGPLGLPPRDIPHLNSKFTNQPFKFEGDINDLPELEANVEKNPSDSDDDESEDQEEDIETTFADAIQESEIISTNQLAYDLPQWFLHDFVKGHFPSYFMNLIIHNLHVCPILIEDFSLPPAEQTSTKIVGAIYRLLVTGVHKKSYSMKYMTRGERGGIRHYRLMPEGSLIPSSYPSLHNLNEMTISAKEHILMETLGIRHKECLDELPSAWKLYIAVIKYWIDQAGEKYYKLHCYVNSLLLSILLCTLDEKIGTYRVLSRFQNKCRGLVSQLQDRRRAGSRASCLPTDISVVQAYNELDRDDCLLAAATFISQCEFDDKLHSNPKRFDRTIVHAFAEFQICLRYSMDLNALLRYPCTNVNIASLFNGTFLYNICFNLKSRKNVETYITTILQNSPTLLRLFNTLVLKLKPLFSDVLEASVSTDKIYNRRNRKKRARSEDICI